jgi:hypothetical protein
VPQEIESLLEIDSVDEIEKEENLELTSPSKLCKTSLIIYILGWLTFPALYFYVAFFDRPTSSHAASYVGVFVLIVGLISMGVFHVIGLFFSVISERCKLKTFAILVNLLSLPVLYLLLCVLTSLPGSG